MNKWRPESAMNEALKTKHSRKAKVNQMLSSKCDLVLFSEMNETFSRLFKSLEFLVLFFQEKRTQKKLNSTSANFNIVKDVLKYRALSLLSATKSFEFICTK